MLSSLQARVAQAASALLQATGSRSSSSSSSGSGGSAPRSSPSLRVRLGLGGAASVSSGKHSPTPVATPRDVEVQPLLSSPTLRSRTASPISTSWNTHTSSSGGGAEWPTRSRAGPGPGLYGTPVPEEGKRRMSGKLLLLASVALLLLLLLLLLFVCAPELLRPLGLSPLSLSSPSASFFAGFLSRRRVLLTMACSADRLGTELPPTLRSLLAQSVLPHAIRVYAPRGERGVFEAAVEQARQQGDHPLAHPLVELYFVEDVGPGTKFLYALEELARGAGKQDDQAGENQPHAPPTPTPPSPLLIVCDNDHYYPPHWLATLLAAHVSQPDASVGFRGWRANPSLSWGVVGEAEIDRHVQLGWRITQPYRVSVLTANVGYLLDSAWFREGAESPPRASCAPRTPAAASESAPPPGAYDTSTGDLFQMLQVTSHTSPLVQRTPSLWPCRFVDDIWMGGHLARLGIPRLVVPLPHARPVDLTRSHTLETRMRVGGWTRITANDAALVHFGADLRREGIWYHHSSSDAGKDARSQYEAGGVQATLGWIREWVKQRQWDAGWI